MIGMIDRVYLRAALSRLGHYRGLGGAVGLQVHCNVNLFVDRLSGLEFGGEIMTNSCGGAVSMKFISMQRVCVVC